MYQIVFWLLLIIFGVLLLFSRSTSKNKTMSFNSFTTVEDIIDDYRQLIDPVLHTHLIRRRIHQMNDEEKVYQRKRSCHNFSYPKQIGRRQYSKTNYKNVQRARSNC